MDMFTKQKMLITWDIGLRSKFLYEQANRSGNFAYAGIFLKIKNATNVFWFLAIATSLSHFYIDKIILTPFSLCLLTLVYHWFIISELRFWRIIKD